MRLFIAPGVYSTTVGSYDKFVYVSIGPCISSALFQLLDNKENKNCLADRLLYHALLT